MAEELDWTAINEAVAHELTSIADFLQIPNRILRAFQLDPEQRAENMPPEAIEHIRSTIVAGIDRLSPDDQEAVRDTWWGSEPPLNAEEVEVEDDEDASEPADGAATSDPLANTSIADTGIAQSQPNVTMYPIINAEGDTAVFDPPPENPDAPPPPGWRRDLEFVDRSMISPRDSSEEPETGVQINEEGVVAFREELERSTEED